MLASCDVGLLISVEKLEILKMRALFFRGTSSEVSSSVLKQLSVSSITFVLHTSHCYQSLLSVSFHLSLPAAEHWGENFCRGWETKMRGWFRVIRSNIPVKDCILFLPLNNCGSCFLEFKWNSHGFSHALHVQDSHGNQAWSTAGVT